MKEGKLVLKDEQGNIITTIRPVIFREANNAAEYLKRYNVIHYCLKKLFYPFLKIGEYIVRKYMVTHVEQVPKEWYNNHIRIFYNTAVKSIRDTFYNVNFKIDVKRYGKDAHLDFFKPENLHKDRGFRLRKLACDLLVTEILEDTFDREWINKTMLGMYHELHKLYKGNVPTPEEYPVYDSKQGNDFKYFVKGIKYDFKIWGNEK